MYVIVVFTKYINSPSLEKRSQKSMWHDMSISTYPSVHNQLYPSICTQSAVSIHLYTINCIYPSVHNQLYLSLCKQSAVSIHLYTINCANDFRETSSTKTKSCIDISRRLKQQKHFVWYTRICTKRKYMYSIYPTLSTAFKRNYSVIV